MYQILLMLWHKTSDNNNNISLSLYQGLTILAVFQEWSADIYLTESCHIYKYQFSVPVCIWSEFSDIHRGSDNPNKMENPIINKFRVEFKSTNWRFESPTAPTIPAIEQKLISNEFLVYYPKTLAKLVATVAWHRQPYLYDSMYTSLYNFL